MISSKQLWPAGPRNAKVAWKKKPHQTPKAKAAPNAPGASENAEPKPKAKARKKQIYELVHPNVNRFHFISD